MPPCYNCALLPAPQSTQQYAFGKGAAKHYLQSLDCLITQTVVNGAKQAVCYFRESLAVRAQTHINVRTSTRPIQLPKHFCKESFGNE